MKKLSDYRIREENGKFIVQVKETTVTRRFLLKNLVKENWIYASLFYSKLSQDGGLIACKDVFDTLEAATAQIIKWCEEPKYHYVVGHCGKYDTQSIPPMDIPWSVGMSAICRELPSWAAVIEKEQLSRADIEYMAKRKAEKKPNK